VGLNKAETAEKSGDEQVHLWRRGYEIKPPGGESLADVVVRVRPYFEAEIWPHVAAGENVLVSAHGNSLRAVLVIIGEYDAEDIPNIELPTGKPLVFDIENGEKKRKYYLED
jgi:2,3-bisphosphoglycerate-dependent phosphoglycerate mutase